MQSIYFSLISLFLAIIGQWNFYVLKKPIFGIVFFILAAIIFIVSDFFLLNKNDSFSIYEKNESVDYDINKRTEIIFLIIVIAVSIFYRFYDISNVPIGCFRDEGKLALDSYYIMKEKQPMDARQKYPVYIHGLTDNPAMFNYIMSAGFKLIGSGVVEARVITAFLSVLGIISFYFLLRFLFGIKIALFGLLFLSFMRWHITFSRLILHPSFAIFVFIIFLYFLFKTLKEEKLYQFLFLGLALGLSQHTYQAARAIPFAILLLLIFWFFKKPDFLIKNYKKLIILIIVFFIVFSPLLLYISKHYDEFMARAKWHYIFNEVNMRQFSEAKGNLKYIKIYLENAKKTLLMFNMVGPGSYFPYNTGNMPMLDFWIGIFAFLGFGYTLFRFFTFSKFAIILITLFAVFMHGGILFADAPHAARTILTLPFFILFTCVFLEKVYFQLKEFKYTKTKYIIYILFAGIIIFSAIENYDKYFNKYGKHPFAWDMFESDKRKAAEYFLSLGNNWHGVLDPTYMHGNLGVTAEFDIVMSKVKEKNYEKFVINENFPANPELNKNYTYILNAEYIDLLSLFKKVYPGGKYKPFYKKYNENVLSFFAYEVPLEEIKKSGKIYFKNGLRGRYYNGLLWEGEPVIERVDPVIYFCWDASPPIKPDFSVAWSGKIKAEKEGEYTFTVNTWQNFELYIDNNLVLQNKLGNTNPIIEKKILLKKGLHKIKINYNQSVGGFVYLYWIQPGDKKKILMDDFLLPD